MFRPKAGHIQASTWHKHKTAITNSFYGKTKISVVRVIHVLINSKI
jgi:hypothetical protein